MKILGSPHICGELFLRVIWEQKVCGQENPLTVLGRYVKLKK